jgi:hypothetical protein
MWGGIVRTFTHKQNPEALGSDATLADAWFGTAALIFLTNGETTMAGRSVQEWAESRLLLKDSSGAQVFFLASGGFFSLNLNEHRLQELGLQKQLQEKSTHHFSSDDHPQKRNVNT